MSRDLNNQERRNSIDVSLKELDFEIPSWKNIYNYTCEMAKDIQKSNFTPDIIVGISRGGWIPTRIISDLLENSCIANVSVEFYKQIGETKSKPIITQPISVSIKNKNILLVDDVADTGQSLKVAKSHLEKKGASVIKIATVYYKPWSIIIPDYYKIKTKLWIIFPWEIKESIKKILQKFREPKSTIEDIKDKLIKLGLDAVLIDDCVKDYMHSI